MTYLFNSDQERTRIQKHLQNIETILLTKDVSALPKSVQLTRQKHIESLNKYLYRGEFPHNYDFPDKPIPYFIDCEGRPCAVAHLMIGSGEEQLASEVSRLANNAYVAEIAELNLPALGEWVEKSGLSLEELAMIQPSYEWR